MEHRRVDIHGHLYQWVDSTYWAARVHGAGGEAHRYFFDLESALDWVENKPQFVLDELKCIRAFKLPATGSLTEEGKK